METDKKAEISVTKPEIEFLIECVNEGYFHSEIDNAEELSISILRKLKKVN